MNEALPFGIRDAGGRLLLAAGVSIERAETLDELRCGELFADEAESSDWRRRLAGAMDMMILKNASLNKIASVAPTPERVKEPSPRRELGFIEQWGELTLVLDGVLRDMRPDTAWMARLMAVSERALRLADRRPDASLYHLIFTAGHTTERYSTHHGLLCMLIARQTARMLGLADAHVHSLNMAALTMNVSIRRLQDLLAASDKPVTPAVRAEITAHPEASARQLEAAGVADPAWIEIVRLHHDDSRKHLPLGELNEVQCAARVLRRVDVFVATLSCRTTRVPMSPVQAAREACLGADGTPDEIGAALLKSVGLYPPGSFVQLISGEMGIVVARGRRANLPVVAALVSPNGAPLGVPAIRDTLDKRYGVKCAVGVQAVKVRPPHEQLIAMR